MLRRWLGSLSGRHDPHEVIAARLYARAVERARHPAFYADWAVPDTVDGRFDAIALHVWLILRALRGKGEAADGLAQALYDVFMGDMDRSLREMGAGDLGVGKRVKAMAQALMGRIKAYDEGLAGPDDRVMVEALKRNLLRGVDPARAETAAPYLARYVVGAAAAVDAADPTRALAGDVDFGSGLPTPASMV